MDYPIFNSIINHIQEELNRRELPIKQFKKWQEQAINASGLEITIDLSEITPFISIVEINLDWDKFREIRLAKQLNGMEQHPLLKNSSLPETNIDPNIDVEITWHFNEQMVLDEDLTGEESGKIETASQWMQGVNERLHDHLPDDNITNRWHVEIEGSDENKYLSNMNLISYLQYCLTGKKELNEIHQTVTKKIQQLLILTNKVVDVAEKSFPRAMAE